MTVYTLKSKKSKAPKEVPRNPVTVREPVTVVDGRIVLKSTVVSPVEETVAETVSTDVNTETVDAVMPVKVKKPRMTEAQRLAQRTVVKMGTEAFGLVAGKAAGNVGFKGNFDMNNCQFVPLEVLPGEENKRVSRSDRKKHDDEQ